MRIEDVAKELAKIEDKNGRLTADAVVEAARAEDNPLHNQFEWDDSAAAEKYRQHQARRLIEKVTVLVERETVQINAVAYVRDPDAAPKEQGYRHITRIASEEDLARDMLATEFSRAAALFRRARKLASVVGLTDEVEILEREVGLLHSRIQEEGRA